MTLLITVFAAVICSILWYVKKESPMKLGLLALMYWGAALMWLVDAIFEFAELGADYFAPAAADVANDAFLGLAVVALGLIVWFVVILVKDPTGRLRAALRRQP